MRFDNHWLNQSYQDVTVHLKKRVFKFNKEGKGSVLTDAFTGKTENLGCHEELYDVEEGKPRSMTVRVKRHGLSLREKLAVVAEAALKEFGEDVNRFSQSHYLASTYAKGENEPDIVIDPKFLKWIAGETATPYLDKDHKLQVAPPHMTTAQAMLASVPAKEKNEQPATK
jgi:hypothetical protein